MRKPPATLLLVLLLGLLAAAGAAHGPAAADSPAVPDTLGRYQVTDQVLHQIDSGWQLKHVYASDDRRRVALSATRGGRDGKVHLDAFGQKLEFDKGGYFWIEGQGESPRWDALLSADWSPDGHHFAYVALKGKKMHVVVDGGEVGAYDYVLERKVQFSPDGAHYGFLVARLAKKRPEAFQVVVDGVAGEPFDMVRGPEEGPLLVFSPTGGHWVAFALMGKQTHALVDGRPGPPFDDTADIPVFSADGRHLAYVGVRGEDWFLVEDDSLHGPFPWVCDPVFSPVADDLAYCVNEEDRGWVVVDGRPLPSHHVVRKPLFSPDGRRLAYLAFEPDGGSCVVVDSTAGPLQISASTPQFLDNGKLFYDVYLDSAGTRRAFYLEDQRLGEMDGSFAWLPFTGGGGGVPGLWLSGSPDGRHYAYGWRVDESEENLVVDGQPWDRWEHLFLAGPLAWSADGAHYAFRAAGKQECIVVDGEPGPLYRSAMGVAFSPDGTEVAYVASREKNEEMLVIGGHEGPTWNDILPSSIKFQPDGSLIHYGVARKGRELHRVVLTPRP